MCSQGQGYEPPNFRFFPPTPAVVVLGGLLLYWLHVKMVRLMSPVPHSSSIAGEEAIKTGNWYAFVQLPLPNNTTHSRTYLTHAQNALTR